jgi:hypothetical protein
MDILSRIDFSNQSVGAIQIDDNHEKTGASVDFSLRDVTLNLFPLPINIQLPTLGGKLLFEQVRNGFIRWVSGVYQYGDRLEFRMHFPFLSSIPLHLTGEGGGKVQLNVEESGGVDLKDQLHFSQLKGSFFNSQHQELFFELEHCSVAYQYKLGELSFEVSFSLLSGTVKITGSVRLTGDLPVRCEIEVKNLDCQYFYQMNPKIWRVLSGQISGILVHQACRGENLTSITFLVENGVLRNLPLISDWFREELENKIYYLPFKKIEMKGKIENHQFHVEEILADGEEELQKIISTVKRDFILEKKKTSDSFWKPYLDYFHRCYTPLKTFFEGKKWGFPKGFPLINSYQ